MLVVKIALMCLVSGRPDSSFKTMKEGPGHPVATQRLSYNEVAFIMV
jgi:hypothetical protein